MSASSFTNTLVSAIQLISGLLSNLHLTEPLWPQNAQVKDGSTFDFVIVGAGTAGSAVAARLSEIEDISILLIEAGGNPPITSVVPGAFPLLSYDSKYDWQYKSEFDPNFAQGHQEKTLNLTSGKMLGGSSALNHLIYARGFPYDYNRWAETVNDESWNYDNIFKYLLKTENLKDKAILESEFAKYHGKHGSTGTEREHHTSHDRYLEAFKEVGYNVLIDSSNGKMVFGEMLYLITENTRQSTAQTYLINQVEKNKRDNISILKNTLVTKVLFDGKVAKGVTALNKDNEEVTFYARKEVILSAGAFNSPKLLQLSGVGLKEDLKNLNIPVIADLPVGENYQDHPCLFLIENVKPLPLIPTYLIPNLLEFPVPGMVGFASLNGSLTIPDIQDLTLVVRNKLLFSLFCSTAFSYSNEVCDSILSNIIGDEFSLIIPTLLNPSSRGKVFITSTDPKEPPVIRTGMLTEEADRERMIDIIEESLRIEKSSFFRNAGAKLVEIDLPECKQYTFRSRDYWRCYIKYMSSATYHYGCSCAMGSVVDNELKIYGLENIRVVDASVMPYLTSGKIEIPVLVIAEKAADMIKATYGYASTENSNESEV